MPRDMDSGMSPSFLLHGLGVETVTYVDLHLCMQALPIFLDNMFHPVVAVILSVTFVLAFGEVSSASYQGV